MKTILISANYITIKLSIGMKEGEGVVPRIVKKIVRSLIKKGHRKIQCRGG